MHQFGTIKSALILLMHGANMKIARVMLQFDARLLGIFCYKSTILSMVSVEGRWMRACTEEKGK